MAPEKIRDGYGPGYTPGGGDSSPGGLTHGFPSPSVTDQSGIHGHGRTPSNQGSSSFLNRPISGGKPGLQIDTTNGHPSILAGRKSGPSGSDAGKLVDSRPGSPGYGQPSRDTGSGSGGYGPSHGTGSGSGGRLPSSGRTNLPSFNQVSGGGSGLPSDNLPPSGRQPIRSGTYDSTPSGQPDRKTGSTGLQPIDHSSGKQPLDRYEKNRPGSVIDSRVAGIASNLPSTDVLDGLRQVFKLPPGLCLVKCDTVRPGQSLTPEELATAFSPKDSKNDYKQPGKPTEQQYTTSNVLSGAQGLPPGKFQFKFQISISSSLKLHFKCVEIAISKEYQTFQAFRNAIKEKSTTNHFHSKN